MCLITVIHSISAQSAHTWSASTGGSCRLYNDKWFSTASTSSWLFEFSFAVLHTFQTSASTFLLTKSEPTLPLCFPTKSTWLSLVRSSQTSANVQLETCVSKLVQRPSTVTFPSFSVTQLSFSSSSPPATHTHTPDYLLPSSFLSYALLFCIPYSILPSLPPLEIQPVSLQPDAAVGGFVWGRARYRECAILWIF